jgi:hypothetical protein
VTRLELLEDGEILEGELQCSYCLGTGWIVGLKLVNSDTLLTSLMCLSCGYSVVLKRWGVLTTSNIESLSYSGVERVH